MAAKEKKEEFEGSFFARPLVGTVFTILSGLSFLALTMILPLVGPAAARGSGSPQAYQAPWYGKNLACFVAVVLLSLALGALAIISKLERRKIDNSPLPYFSIGLCGICVFLLVTLLTGLLAI